MQTEYGQSFENVTVVMHNAVFDAYILKEVFGITPHFIVDTMLMSRLLNGPFLSASLDDVAKRYGLDGKLDLEFTKGIRELSPVQISELRQYAIRDVSLTRQLADKLLPLVPPEELQIINHTIKCFLNSPLLIDTPVVLKARQALGDGITPAILPYTLGELRSNPSFIKILQHVSGGKVDVLMKPGANGDVPALAKDDKFMKGLLCHENPEVKALAEKRLLAQSFPAFQKRLDYLYGTAGLTNGVMPVYLSYARAISGRFSGGNRCNIQNLPIPERLGNQLLKDAAMSIRKALHAPKGYVLVAVDACQIEARILAWITGEKILCDAFAAGKDIYSEFASATFNEHVEKAYGDTPEAKRMNGLRTVGKTWSFSRIVFAIETSSRVPVASAMVAHLRRAALASSASPAVL